MFCKKKIRLACINGAWKITFEAGWSRHSVLIRPSGSSSNHPQNFWKTYVIGDEQASRHFKSARVVSNFRVHALSQCHSHYLNSIFKTLTLPQRTYDFVETLISGNEIIWTPGFPDQADHNLNILWHHTNHTNFLTMTLP